METTLKNLEVWANSAEIKVSRAGQQYVKCTAIERDGDGNISRFLNLCFFPETDKCLKLRDILCQGRVLHCTGNYSEREYTGRDGTSKTAYDMLCHNVQFGEVAQWEGGERKTTDFSFIKESTEKATEAELKKAEAKRAKAQAKPKQTTTVDMNDAIFDDLDL